MGVKSGVIIVDKPEGMTSFQVVKTVRKILQVKKAGHTGTLDPLATGVLPVCIGEGTKLAGLLTAEDKVYLATALLGVVTDTLDTTGEVLAKNDPAGVTKENVEKVIAGMKGDQLQTPPAFSAIHVDGERAYEKARRGEKVELAPREIRIDQLELRNWQHPSFDLFVSCSKGTYIRTLISDIGEELGCGATMSALRRLRCGPFDIEQSTELEKLEEAPLISLDQALSHMAKVDVGPNEVVTIRYGQPIVPEGPLPAGVIRIRCDGELVALGEMRNNELWPKRVFNL